MTDSDVKTGLGYGVEDLPEQAHGAFAFGRSPDVAPLLVGAPMVEARVDVLTVDVLTVGTRVDVRAHEHQRAQMLAGMFAFVCVSTEKHFAATSTRRPILSRPVCATCGVPMMPIKQSEYSALSRIGRGLASDTPAGAEKFGAAWLAFRARLVDPVNRSRRDQISRVLDDERADQIADLISSVKADMDHVHRSR